MGGACCAEAPASQTEEVPPEKTAVQPQPVAKPGIGDEFTVTLTKDGDQKLGLDISHFGEGDKKTSLKIKGVKDGLVKQWNEKNPNSSIDKDDLIVSINGVKDSSEDLLKQVRASELVVVVKKGGAK